MNVHILNGDKFSNGEIAVFECFYPGENIYIVHSKNGEQTFEPQDIECSFLDLTNMKSIKVVEDKCNQKIDNVFVYYLLPVKSKFALKLIEKHKAKLYWVFYGADLYTIINRKGYVLHDYKIEHVVDNYKVKTILNRMRSFVSQSITNQKYFTDFIKKCDYFCFWNKYDHELLNRYFKTQIGYKFYAHGLGRDISDTQIIKIDNQVQINHSANMNGNHLTILKKLKSIDLNNILKYIIPVSYGSDDVRYSVENYVKNEIKNECVIMKDFLPIEEYHNFITSSAVAIFGSRRQEAGFNIFSHLLTGSKVFLRNDNNMIQLIRDWGGVVFSFEDDLNSIDDILTPLTETEVKINKEMMQKYLSKEAVAKSMVTVLDK